MINRKDMVVVSIMPCVAKKYECSREEFATMVTPMLISQFLPASWQHLIKQANIDFKSLPDEDFDKPLGESTGAAVIFGTTGGVIEAAARTAYELYTGKTLESVDFKALRGFEGIRSASVDFNGVEIKIGIAHGLGNARKLLDDVKAGKSEFHAIEIMACPGGCIGGGGQPLHHGDSSILKARAKAIYSEDEGKTFANRTKTHTSSNLYEEFLGKPMSEKAHHLLHTHYFDKKSKQVLLD
jgi:NADP-reducing hydrogenase subunit HndD